MIPIQYCINIRKLFVVNYNNYIQLWSIPFENLKKVIRILDEF